MIKTETGPTQRVTNQMKHGMEDKNEACGLIGVQQKDLRLGQADSVGINFYGVYVVGVGWVYDGETL